MTINISDTFQAKNKIPLMQENGQDGGTDARIGPHRNPRKMARRSVNIGQSRKIFRRGSEGDTWHFGYN